jgi:hypothetical protein
VRSLKGDKLQPITRELPPEISFAFVSDVQKHLRKVMVSDQFQVALKEATVLIEELLPTSSSNHKPRPSPRTPKQESLPRPIVTEHRENVFVFSDGTSIASCTATNCMWGHGHLKQQSTGTRSWAWRKTHSDRLLHPPVDADDESEEIVEVPELGVERTLIAGDDQDEPEETQEDFVERDLEAEEFSREGGLVAECE